MPEATGALMTTFGAITALHGLRASASSADSGPERAPGALRAAPHER